MRKRVERHLIVDGYNVIHALSELKPWMGLHMEVARDKLLGLVKVIHDTDGIRVTLVFDGQGEKMEVERPTKETSLSVVFAPSSLSADGLIEQLVGRSEEPGSITAVTRDNMISETLATLGAHTITPEELVDWVARSDRRQGEKVQQVKKKETQSWKEANRLGNLWEGL